MTLGYQFILIISHLPLKVLYVISDILYFFACHVIQYRKAVIRQNLRYCFPELTEKQLQEITKKYYRNLCDIIVESIKIRTMDEKLLHQMITLDESNKEAARHTLATKQNILLFLGHFNNWELLGQILQVGYPHHLKVTYQALKNKVSDKFVYDIRSHFGQIPILRSNITRYVIQHRTDFPVMYAFLADQRPRANFDEYDFFGHKTHFYSSIVGIAQKMNMAVYYVETIKERRGKYKVNMQLITDTPAEMDAHDITRRYVSLLEQSIRKQPEGWLWSHRRWKNII